jgi:hypothetical protein
MKSKLLLHCFSIVSIFLSSCCHDITCSTAVIDEIGFISFTNSSVNNLVLRRFVKGTNFNVQKDSVIIDSFHTINRYQRGDTIIVTPGNYYSSSPDTLYQYNISAKYDFEIFVPSTNTLVKIDKITEKQDQVRSCPPESIMPYCYNTILTYTVNGIVFQSQDNNPIIYVTK